MAIRNFHKEPNILEKFVYGFLGTLIIIVVIKESIKYIVEYFGYTFPF